MEYDHRASRTSPWSFERHQHQFRGDSNYPRDCLNLDVDVQDFQEAVMTTEQAERLLEMVSDIRWAVVIIQVAAIVSTTLYVIR